MSFLFRCDLHASILRSGSPARKSGLDDGLIAHPRQLLYAYPAWR